MKVWQKSILALSASAALTPAVMAKDLDTVVSFSVMADIVKQVGGEHVHVTTLVGPDGDPHTFEPAAKDSVTLKQADVVFINGLGLEGWMDRLVTASGYQGDVVTMSNGVTTLTMEEDGEHLIDPHAWNSAKNGAIYARNVMNALIKADPEDADYYKAKGQAYIEQLEKLDQWAKSEFAEIPVEKRKVLTSHDAFGYFGEAYGVSFLSPVGVSTEAQASAKGVAELIDQLKSEHISAYFIENQTDPRLVEQIAKASGA
ncbi:metal ABC transporter solute-binding protein, Zn/Mn family [Vibrio sp. HB161653]|uniref:metal ABC transporter solute-binding protein, Zn/Mn family n=1 Tax=Vibrio sp. HB161653 TaxID=3068274 RepID=UPI00273E2AE5|nr:zinc ABC transporter substrate-binding protein [Vibrio sp. HB161653]MDP5252877.1 zinc ABC transporter substrate-binding protein [Vibrio sp. HB161653]